MPYTYPAQHQLVQKYIDWELAESRLSKYEAIGRCFPMSLLKSHQETQPYFCHYMAWRLGTFWSDSIFAHFNELLAHAESLPNWASETSLIKSPDFSDFWSLLWQLQVAEYLSRIGSNVQWLKSGPDLSAEIEGEKWFIECYCYRKSFGLLLFIEEILELIHPLLRTSYDMCLPFSLPRNREISEFLNRVLSDFLDPVYLKNALEQAEQQYPVILYEGESSLVIYAESMNSDAYMPGIIPNNTGRPETYMQVALREAIAAKCNANSLAQHRPNMLVVNFLMSQDFQISYNQAIQGSNSITTLELGSNIDAFAVSTIGINQRLTCENLRRVEPQESVSSALRKMTHVA